MKSKILLKILMPFLFLLTAFTAVAQSITPSGSITAFTATYGSAATEQSFTFTATGLTASTNVVVTAPANFEVSLSSGSGFAASVNVPTDGSGDVASTTIYVRMPSGINAGSVTGGNITLAEGATNQTVAIPNSTVNPKALTITSPSIAIKVYDGTPTAGTLTIGTLSGFVGTETVTATGSATDYSSKNVGNSYTSTVSYVLANGTNGGLAANYTAPANDVLNLLEITAKTITIASPIIDPKVYDGTPAAGAITLGAVTGLIGTETLAITPSATAYSNANVGASYSTTVSYAIADGTNGGLAANYSALANDNVTGLSITPKALTITAPTIASKAYDGSTAAGAITLGTLSGLVNTETIVVTPSATAYSSANVGAAYTSTVTYVIADGTNGGLASNYTAPVANNLTGLSITPIAITITANSESKVYGTTLTSGTGKTTFTLSSGTLVGTETIGSVTLTYGTGAAPNAPVAVNTGTIVPSAATGGTFNPANYTITYANGDITVTPAPLTITANAVTKEHGNTLPTTVTGSTAFTATGLVNWETIGSVTINYSAGTASGDAIAVYSNAVAASAPTSGTFTASNYTITYVPADLTIVVSTNAFLSDLVASTGPLNTAFNKFDLDYDTYVLTAIDQFTVTATVENQFATIQARIDNTGFGPGAYVPLTSGVASAPFTIREGDNIIEILVTAEDGTTQLNYRILYRRESSFVSGGGGGGLESKSLGDAIAQRVLNNAINDMNGAVDYNKLPVVETAQGTIRSTSTNSIFSLQLSSIMPDLSNRGYKAYNSSPVDIVSFTNAKEVFAVDYVNTNKETKAVAFTTKTLGELYDHTKPICDRLKGATLLDVESVKIDGYDFINYTIRNDKGNLEYATAFTVGAKAGRNNFNLQSAFLTTSYVNEDQMYNFQIWAASPTIVNDMVKEVLAKLKDVAPVNQSIVNASPDTYIESGKREGANLNLVIKNGTAATTGFFKFEDRSNESSTGIVTRNVPFTVKANGTSTISVPVGDKYESSISMFLNGEVKDMLYMSDGTWAIDYNRNTTSVSAFTVTNDAKRTISANEYPVLRNVEVKANSSDFVSLFKLLKAGGMEADLSGYAGLKFTAAGGYNLRVTMVQNGISEWKNQYTTDIRLGSGQQEYFIPFSQFKSAGSIKNIDPKDVTTLVFTVEVNAGRNSPIASTFSNISFTKEKPVLSTTDQEEKTIQVFPNPVTDNVFTASFVSPVAGELTMKINDASGRSIFTKQVNVVKGPNAVPVRLNNGVIGTHFLTLEGKGVKFAPTTVVIVK